MTGLEIKTMIEALVDDTLDDTIAYQIINNKINEIEAERPWKYLKTTSTSLTATTSTTHDTANTIPTDCATLLKIEVGDMEYKPKPLQDKKEWEDITGYYFVKGSSFYLSGTVDETKTITITYRAFSTEITSATSPSFPTRFHKMLAYFGASEYYIMDAGEKAMSWSNELFTRGELLLRQMRLWDAEQQSNEVNTNQQMNTNYGNNFNKYQDNVIN